MNLPFWKKKKFKYTALPILVAIAVIAIIWLGMIYRQNRPDTYCTTTHIATTKKPEVLENAKDFLALGDYDFEIGDCRRAIGDYTRAIENNPNYAEAYNNRAYTYMRLQEYEPALSDLDMALKIRPSYPNALMNRADIYNFYFAVDRQKALADYDKIILIEGNKKKNLCRNRLIAKNNGRWNLEIIWKMVTGWRENCE